LGWHVHLRHRAASNSLLHTLHDTGFQNVGLRSRPKLESVEMLKACFFMFFPQSAQSLKIEPLSPFSSQSLLHQECWEAESDSDLLEELSINDDAQESLTRSSVLVWGTKFFLIVHEGEILAITTKKIEQ
jgi:hypothetical protein